MKTPEPERILLESKKGVYFPVPKVACSSIKSAICKELDIDYGNNVHKAVPKIFDYKSEDYRDYFKFAFVRNPYHRLVSCYKSKIAKTKKNTPTIIDGVMRGMALRHPGMFYGGMPFDAFLESVVEIDDKVADDHFKSQHTFLYAEDNHTLLVNFVGKFETINEDYAYIAETLQLSQASLGHFGNSTKKNKDIRDFYTNEMIIEVNQRFSKDFDLFGYDFC